MNEGAKNTPKKNGKNETGLCAENFLSPSLRCSWENILKIKFVTN
jgi:hypothetical protein